MKRSSGSRKTNSTLGRMGATGPNVAARIRDEILDGTLLPGARLGQDALAERFDSSRVPVREALKILEAEGLVTIVPNAGAWVTRLDPFELEQIYKLRERVETLAVLESVPHLTPEQVERLRSLTTAIENAPTTEDYLRLEKEFHQLTVAGAKFAILPELTLRFWNSTQHFRRTWMSLYARDHMWAVNYEHHLIVDAISRKDAESAAAFVELHLRKTRLLLTQDPDLFS